MHLCTVSVSWSLVQMTTLVIFHGNFWNITLQLLTTGKKRRALYSDLLDNEAEKSGSDHSDDENEGTILNF